jgi:hypothetical protein
MSAVNSKFGNDLLFVSVKQKQLNADKHIVKRVNETFNNGREKFAVYYLKNGEFIQKHDAMLCTSQKGNKFYMVMANPNTNFAENELISIIAEANGAPVVPKITNAEFIFGIHTGNHGDRDSPSI